MKRPWISIAHRDLCVRSFCANTDRHVYRFSGDAGQDSVEYVAQALSLGGYYFYSNCKSMSLHIGREVFDLKAALGRYVSNKRLFNLVYLCNDLAVPAIVPVDNVSHDAAPSNV